MKKAYKYILPAIFAVISLAGCENDGPVPEACTGSSIPTFTASIGAQSRAHDSTWDPGDSIGVSCDGYSNICYITPGGDGRFTVKNSNEQLYYPDEKEVSFTAYYPWSSTTTTFDLTQQQNQYKYDFLCAEGRGSKAKPDVDFIFFHKMSKVTINIRPGEDMSYDDIKKMKITFGAIKCKGSFDINKKDYLTVNSTNSTLTLSDGTTSPNDVPYMTFNDDDRSVTFSLIFPPQTFSAGTSRSVKASATLTANNHEYTVDYSQSINFKTLNDEKDDNARNEFVSGRQYNINLTLSKYSLSLTTFSIKDWTSGSSGSFYLD